MLPFDPLRFPLHGQLLIEASAGTGKTFSIALLFLRLLLERKLDVDKILVVTFTTAATEELRSRISERMREALQQLEQSGGSGGNEPAEGMLAQLLAGVGSRQEAETRLTDALARMDEAAVYTIHGFCQRMLQENAFEADALFEIEFLESEKPLRSQIIEDYWRRRFYSSSAEEAAWAISLWGNPEGLERNISGVAARPFVEYVPAISAEEVDQAEKKAAEHFRRIRSEWLEHGAAVAAILRHDKCLSRNRRDGYGPERVEQVISRMNGLEEETPMPWILPREMELLSATVMQDKLIGKKECPEHEFFTRFDVFFQRHREFVRTARFRVLAEAGRFLGTELARRKNSKGRIYYDDLLVKLDRALSGPGAQDLVNRIRSRFAAAMVDEFQDTDPVQYRIVRRLFGEGPESALFMIGDPKQSVYSFRGADIFTYIKARRETPDEGCFTMDTNFRSTSAMVSAVNNLFKPQDSFVFSRDIRFHPVKAGGQAEAELLLLQDKPPLPLQAMIINPEDNAKNSAGIAKAWAEKEATRRTAHEIARLLLLGAGGRATLGGRNLSGGDLAVLVRTHAEAALMQQALSGLDIASVYYSQDSVFATDEASRLYQVLFALRDLSDEHALRLALVTDLFGLNGTKLYLLQQDDAGKDALAGEVREYHDCLNAFGPMALFQKMLAGREIVQRLLAVPGGERRLTNYLHLAELLQEASLKLEGIDSLIRWFRDRMHDPEPEKASQQLRLESDENLVKIITIHKSKGLEYPVVFLPYLWRARPVGKDAVFCFHHPDTGEVLADLGTENPEYYRLAERERLAEDLRLLYVAVTRARHMCCFCWGRIKGMDATSLAWLLHRKGAAVPAAGMLDDRQVVRDLSRLNDSGPVLDYLPDLPDSQPIPVPEQREQKILRAKVFAGKIETGWGITSYSQLTARSGTQEVGPEQFPAGVPADWGREHKDSVFGFPRGVAAGNCLHAVLEQLDFADIDEGELLEQVASHLADNGLERGWAPVVCGWIKDIVATPLNASADICLMDIGREHRLAELGFYFSMTNLDILEINRALADFSFPPLDCRPSTVNGLMKGFIDLVFCSAGRYFIADYKSNYLGSTYGDYQPHRLAAAMAEHRYDLQYLIYTVALHRYLGTRIEGYRYDRDFGGVYYLFLRGMNPSCGTGSGIFFTRPPQHLVERLDQSFGYPERP